MRIVLFSCAGAPLGAEIADRIREQDPRVLEEIVGVVLSLPRVHARRAASESATRAGLASPLAGLEWRWNNLRWRTGVRFRRIMSRFIAMRYRRIEDLCSQRDIPVHTTNNINSPESVARVAAWKPDLIVITTFHHILKPAVIALPRIAALNVHCSLLPRHRGADPIAMALAEGVSETGITIHWVDEGIDTGDIVVQRAVSVDGADTDDRLRPRLARIGAELLLDCIEQARAGRLGRRPQEVTRERIPGLNP